MEVVKDYHSEELSRSNNLKKLYTSLSYFREDERMLKLLWSLLLGVHVARTAVSGFSVVPLLIRANGGAKTFQVLASNEDDDEYDNELSRVPRRRQRGRLYDREEDEEAFYDSVERSVFGDEKFVDDEEEDWDDSDDDEEEEDYGIFSNVLIDNPILDNIDPDGAAERFPELARDPRFWIDMVLFIVFLNWLSAVGPQDYFPDLPYYV